MTNEQIERLDIEAAQLVHAGGSTGRVEMKLASGNVISFACDLRQGKLTGEKEPEPEPVPQVEKLADWQDEESALVSERGRVRPAAIAEQPDAPEGEIEGAKPGDAESAPSAQEIEVQKAEDDKAPEGELKES